MKNNAIRNSIIVLIFVLLGAGLLLSWIIPKLNKPDDQIVIDSTPTTKTTKSECLTAAESWNHIGEKACVIFYPRSFAKSGNYYFIDEKEDYKNGFVVFFASKNSISWDDFVKKYKVGKNLKVTGTIERYEGHPEIKITSLSQIEIQ